MSDNFQERLAIAKKNRVERLRLATERRRLSQEKIKTELEMESKEIEKFVAQHQKRLRRGRHGRVRYGSQVGECVVDGCTKPKKTKDYCSSHAERFREYLKYDGKYDA